MLLLLFQKRLTLLDRAQNSERWKILFIKLTSDDKKAPCCCYSVYKTQILRTRFHFRLTMYFLLRFCCHLLRHDSNVSVFFNRFRFFLFHFIKWNREFVVYFDGMLQQALALRATPTTFFSLSLFSSAVAGKLLFVKRTGKCHIFKLNTQIRFSCE